MMSPCWYFSASSLEMKTCLQESVFLQENKRSLFIFEVLFRLRASLPTTCLSAFDSLPPSFSRLLPLWLGVTPAKHTDTLPLGEQTRSVGWSGTYLPPPTWSNLPLDVRLTGGYVGSLFYFPPLLKDTVIFICVYFLLIRIFTRNLKQPHCAALLRWRLRSPGSGTRLSDRFMTSKLLRRFAPAGPVSYRKASSFNSLSCCGEGIRQKPSFW